MNKTIAVYGTLKRGRGNDSLLRTSDMVGEGWLHGHKMVASGIPFVFKGDEEDKVYVEVYSVTPATLQSLDGLEGHPDWYYRSPVTIDLNDGGMVEAEVYLNDGYKDLPEIADGIY